MNEAIFPTLLNKRAKMLVGLNRTDLVIVSIIYLLMSLFKISGITGLIINIAILSLFKTISNRLPKGFFKNAISEKELTWSNVVENL